jgi:hypothetical protein
MNRPPESTSHASFAVIVAPLALCGVAAAQAPFVPRATLWVTDSSNDRIALVRDLDYDGDYLDAGEVAVFYDDLLGSYPLSNNNTVESLADGSILVADTSADYVLRIADGNADGDGNDPGESAIWFDPSNLSGVAMPTANGIFVAESGDVWIANTQVGTVGKDTIIRVRDLDSNGDGQGAGEAIEYYVSSDLSLGGAANDSLPQDVVALANGEVYYLEIGAGGVQPKGIYKLVDLDSSGFIDAPGEVAPYFVPAPLLNAPFYWAIERDDAGYWYLADTGNDLIWRGFDANSNGTIDAAEMVQWWVSPAASLVWETHVGADGELYVGESQSNERVFAMHDADANGSIDPLGEVATLYDELTALGAPIGQIRGFALDARTQAPSSTYCTPQVNWLGCTPAIAWEGWPSAGYGSGYFVRASNVRSQINGIFFYGINGRVSFPFNGGTMCVAGPRLRTPIQSSGGSSGGFDCTGAFDFDFNAHVASGADPALAEGIVVDGQYWSRDPGSSPGNTNLTDAIEFEIGH